MHTMHSYHGGDTLFDESTNGSFPRKSIGMLPPKIMLSDNINPANRINPIRLASGLGVGSVMSGEHPLWMNDKVIESLNWCASPFYLPTAGKSVGASKWNVLEGAAHSTGQVDKKELKGAPGMDDDSAETQQDMLTLLGEYTANAPCIISPAALIQPVLKHNHGIRQKDKNINSKDPLLSALGSSTTRPKRLLWHLFSLWDFNGDGVLDYDEISVVLSNDRAAKPPKPRGEPKVKLPPPLTLEKWTNWMMAEVIKEPTAEKQFIATVNWYLHRCELIRHNGNRAASRKGKRTKSGNPISLPPAITITARKSNNGSEVEEAILSGGAEGEEIEGEDGLAVGKPTATLGHVLSHYIMGEPPVAGAYGPTTSNRSRKGKVTALSRNDGSLGRTSPHSNPKHDNINGTSTKLPRILTHQTSSQSYTYTYPAKPQKGKKPSSPSHKNRTMSPTVDEEPPAPSNGHKAKKRPECLSPDQLNDQRANAKNGKTSKNIPSLSPASPTKSFDTSFSQSFMSVKSKVQSRVERSIVRPIIVDFSYSDIVDAKEILSKPPRGAFARNPEEMPITVARPHAHWTRDHFDEPDELAITPRILSEQGVSLRTMKEFVSPESPEWPLFAIYPEGVTPPHLKLLQQQQNQQQAENDFAKNDGLLDDDDDESSRDERRTTNVDKSQNQHDHKRYSNTVLSPQGGGLNGNYGIHGKYKATGLKLSNNDIQSWDGWMTALPICFHDIRNTLTYLDVSFNQLTSIPQELSLFVNMNRLFLHGNHFTHLQEVDRLAPLCRSVSVLTLHANPIAGKPNYKRTVLHLFPNLKSLDKSTITNADYVALNLAAPINETMVGLSSLKANLNSPSAGVKALLNKL